MTRVLHHRFVLLPLLGALALITGAAAPPEAPEAGRLHHYEVKAKAGQVVMMPLGEGDRTESHLQVTLQSGVLESVKYHAACGRVLLHGASAERIPAFAPTPSAYGPGGPSRVCGVVGCGCPGSGPGLVHVAIRPQGLAAEATDVVGRFVPVLAGGDTPRPVAEAPEPGCFGWLEMTVDTTGLPVGTQVLADIKTYSPGTSLVGPPTRSDVGLMAAVVTP
ncbi:MAG: hypothetical protein ACI9MR_000391 [Myxococcota bacterium]|jgi:hypothetical protein